MAEKRAIRMRFDHNLGEYYHLLPDKKSYWATAAYALFFPITKPIGIVRFLLGRLVSYAILNPLFRKHEKENIAVVQNNNHPDPNISEANDVVIVSVLPEAGFFRRHVGNWINKFKNSIRNSPFVPLGPDDAPAPLRDEARIHQLMGQVDTLMNGRTLPGQVNVSKIFQPEQIHFKGLHHLPPQLRELFLENLRKTHGYDFRVNAIRYNFFTLKTRSGAELDSVEVRGNMVALQPIENRKFIISCLPRSNDYTDWLKQHRYFADQLDSTIVAFNYRGTGQGKGIISSQRGMRDDAMAQVERLIALGAKPENIGLMGECLGGNIATHVAAELHQKNYKVKLFNSRSFRSTASLLLDRITPEKNASLRSPLNWGKWLCVGLAKVTLVPLLYLTRWDLSVDKAFKSIPVDDRDYLVVRSKKDASGHRYRDDAMVSHAHASIYSLVKEEQLRINAKKISGQTLTQKEIAWLGDQRGAHKFHVDIGQRGDAPTVDGHTAQLRYLVRTKQNLPPEDGREFTLKFFKRAWGDATVPANSEMPMPQMG